MYGNSLSKMSEYDHAFVDFINKITTLRTEKESLLDKGRPPLTVGELKTGFSQQKWFTELAEKLNKINLEEAELRKNNKELILKQLLNRQSNGRWSIGEVLLEFIAFVQPGQRLTTKILLALITEKRCIDYVVTVLMVFVLNKYNYQSEAEQHINKAEEYIKSMDLPERSDLVAAFRCFGL